jgi:GNAT superfamily N-acetyltransferase
MGMRSGAPAELTARDRRDFIAFVASAGEVDPATLPALVDRAAILVMLFEAETLIGTAAIKTPYDRHRLGEFTKANVPDLANAFPLELGWVVIHPDHRGRGHGRALVAATVGLVPDCGVYATTKTPAMWSILKENAFAALGQSYPSVLNPEVHLSLFGRGGIK